jgi:glycosyltransferase involved in cell wall biosynthesis
MRILIDARMMGAGNTRGIGRYIEEILKAMIELRPDHRYILLEKDPSVSPFANDPSVEHVKADIPWYGLAEQIKLPKIIKSANADIFFAPHWNIPLLAPRFSPLVIFIHDLILLEEPDSANISTRGPIIRWIKRLGHRWVLYRALFASRVILVPTQHVADRIRKHYLTLKTKIVVTGEGMPKVVSGERGVESGNLPTYHLPSTIYLLMVGSAYPHKNHATVLEAWKTLSKAHPELRLKIVGEKDQFMRRIEDRVKRMKLPRIEFTGMLPDEALDKTYKEALALLFPSRWEGFGLPPLEALAHETPVLSSNTSCMPEVLGDQGVIYFNPDSPDGIVKAVEDLLRNPGGVREEARKAIGTLQARHDWRKAAARTIRAIEEAVT